MTSSGTEASMSAVRLARAATGPRRGSLKFAGRLPRPRGRPAGRGGLGPGHPGDPGQPGRDRGAGRRHGRRALERPRAVERALAEREPAAILCEPYPANMGLVPPADGFLAFLRERPTPTGALLVFDEVISGFRVAAAARRSGRA